MILKEDKEPLDVLIRRTEALLEYLSQKHPELNFTLQKTELELLYSNRLNHLTRFEKRKLFNNIKTVRRTIALKNPLLNFDEILFIKHDKQHRGEIHMVDQYLGFNQSKRGGIYVLENPFGDNPKVKSLLANSKVTKGKLKEKILENDGSFISLELDYSGNKIYFAYTEAEHNFVKEPNWTDLIDREKNASEHRRYGGVYDQYHWDNDRNFHIFSVNRDGSELTQLTDGKFNDIDPCILPNGRIVFISDRIGGNQRCGGRYCSTYTLHSMMADGTDIIPFSFHETNEWHPSVDNNGMIVYTRWDYVDRDSDIAHHIWHCYPDGRDPRSYHGNYPKIRESRPWMELSIRAIPNSRKYIAVSAPHHGQNYGSLVMIDIEKEDDGSMSQLKRITPEVKFPESELSAGIAERPSKRSRYKGEVYGQPWPLDENFYLAVYSPSQEKHGLYLVDSFGNKELLYQDTEIGLLDPIPLRARTRAPAIPVSTKQAKIDRTEEDELSMGTVTILNIYESQYDWPKGTKINELRIINLFPKPNPVLDVPRIGKADQALARGVLGTVPVEEDGSVHFKCPTGISIYFQALDEKGMMVQNMRSATYLHPGETLSCVGCHEHKQQTPQPYENGMPIALRREASVIEKELSGSWPLSFPRLLQETIDLKCLSCHNKSASAPSLQGDQFNHYGWSDAFQTLQSLGWSRDGGNGALPWINKRSYSLPGQEGARTTKLYKKLLKGHKGVSLTNEEMRRFTLWLDCNTQFYGAYLDIEKQSRGELVLPLLGQSPWGNSEDFIN